VPQLDSFGVDDLRDTTELLSHSMVRGVASVDGPDDELRRGTSVQWRRHRELERDWERVVMD
jgi:hypothetical protein